LGFLALAGSVIGTMLVRRWAIARGFVDQPGHRKIHQKPIALGGGIVIFWITMGPVAAVEVLAVLFHRYGIPGCIPESLVIHIPGLASRAVLVLVLFLGAAAMHILGLIDDRKHLGPWSKLVVQIGAAILLATAGEIRFDFFIPSTSIKVVLSVLWMVVILNAFNFLDNMDGLSAGIAAICAAMILTASYASGQVFVSGLLVLLIGALLGFLVFNFAPAKIFMGDAGSLVVGLLIAVATIRTTYYQEQTQSGPWFAAFMPVVVLAIPLYDFTSVVILRLLQGKSPFVGDKQHFSHRLVNRGMTHRQAVLTIYLATAGTGLGATFLNQVRPVGAVLVLLQTFLIVLIIAILERDPKKNTLLNREQAE